MYFRKGYLEAISGIAPDCPPGVPYNRSEYQAGYIRGIRTRKTQMNTKFEDWLENEKEFVLKTERECQLAKAAWDAALIMIYNLIDTVNIKKGSTDDDVFNAAKAAIKQMPKLPMNEMRTVIATTDIGTIVRRDPAHNKATKNEYLEDYIPKKNVKKAVNKAK